MMTKQDFIALADMIIECRKYDQFSWGEVEIASLAGACKQSNSKFNRDRWFGYINGECGPNGAKFQVRG